MSLKCPRDGHTMELVKYSRIDDEGEQLHQQPLLEYQCIGEECGHTRKISQYLPKQHKPRTKLQHLNDVRRAEDLGAL